MATIKYLMIYGLVVLFGNFAKGTQEVDITTSKSETSVPHLELKEMSTYHDREGVRPPSYSKTGPDFSPKKSKPAMTFTTPQPLPPQNTDNIKHEVGNNSQQLLTVTKTYIGCFCRRGLNIIRDLWKRHLGSFSWLRNIHTMVDTNLNYNKKGFVKNNKETNVSGIQEKPQNSETDQTALLSRNKHVSQELNDLKQPHIRSNSPVSEVSMQNVQENTIKRRKRCVGKDCEGHLQGENRGANNLKQPHHGSNLTVAEASTVALMVNTSVPEVNKAKRCVGKDCEVHNDHNAFAKDTTIKEEEKHVKEDIVLKLNDKELIGLGMIFVLGCFMMYLYIYHGYNGEVRKYTSIGTLALFILCVTVLSEIMDRTQETTRMIGQRL